MLLCLPSFSAEKTKKLLLTCIDLYSDSTCCTVNIKWDRNSTKEGIQHYFSASPCTIGQTSTTHVSHFAGFESLISRHFFLTSRFVQCSLLSPSANNTQLLLWELLTEDCSAAVHVPDVITCNCECEMRWYSKTACRLSRGTLNK